jgi:hypothetical protein
VEFRDEYKDSIKLLLDGLLVSSKSGQILFTSDCQFGPEKAFRVGPVSISEFWDLHDAGKVRMNALYSITIELTREEKTGSKIDSADSRSG